MGRNGDRGFRGYVTSRPFLDERAPQHIQNLVIRDYAQRKGMKYLLSATEYAMPGCSMMLEQLLSELPTIRGVIFYSIFQLPRNRKTRSKVYRRVLNAGCEIHGAVEDIQIRNDEEARSVEDIWQVKEALRSCPDAAAIRAIGTGAVT